MRHRIDAYSINVNKQKKNIISTFRPFVYIFLLLMKLLYETYRA